MPLSLTHLSVRVVIPSVDPFTGRLVRLFGPIALLAPFVAYYVYRDRQRRERPRPLLWAIGLGCFGLFGLFVYLYLRGDFSRGE